MAEEKRSGFNQNLLPGKKTKHVKTNFTLQDNASGGKKVLFFGENKVFVGPDDPKVLNDGTPSGISFTSQKVLQVKNIGDVGIT